MKKLIFLLILVPTFAIGQTTPKETVETYFDGYKKGSPEILKKVFHPNFHLSWASPWHKGDEKFQQVDREGMFAFFGPEWKNLTITASISDMKIDGNMAVCTAVVELKGIVVWTDYISMLKINGTWWIVSKVSDGKLLK